MALQDPAIHTAKRRKTEGVNVVGGNSDLGEQISKLSAQINVETHRLLQLIAEFDRCEGWAVDGARCCADWLNLKCGLATSAARERVRVAKRLSELPAINKAFETGDISYSKVRAITRVATQNNEAQLLQLAKKETAAHLEMLVRKFKQVDYSMEKSLEELYQLRELKYHQDEHGMWIITARLPQDEGGLVVKAIEEIVRQQDKSLNPDNSSPIDDAISDEIPFEQDVETPDGFQAGVSAETQNPEPDPLKCESQASGCPSESCSSDESKTAKVSSETQYLKSDETEGTAEAEEADNWAQKKADALCVMAEAFVSGGDNHQLKALAGHERCQVVLHMNVDTLKHEHNADSQCGCEPVSSVYAPHHLDGAWITPENAKRFSCDASLLTVLQDKKGNVLNVGRKTRTVPPHLARALNIRDETCRFPGCTCSQYVDFHHIKHWAEGGETSKQNLVKLCRFHHRLLHSGLFTIDTTGDKHNPKFVFKMSDGREVGCCS